MLNKSGAFLTRQDRQPCLPLPGKPDPALLELAEVAVRDLAAGNDDPSQNDEKSLLQASLTCDS